MRAWMGIVAVAVLALASGCQTASLSPLYTDETKVTDDRIVGRWVEDKEAEKPDTVVVIEKDGEGQYVLEFVSLNDSEPRPSPHARKLHLVLTRIGAALFADISAHEKWLAEAELEAFAGPVHYFLRLDVEQERISVRIMEHEWLKERLKANPQEIAHVVSRGGRIADPEDPPAKWAHEEGITFTASTKKLRAFLEKAAAEEPAWSEAQAYVRERQERGGGD